MRSLLLTIALSGFFITVAGSFGAGTESDQTVAGGFASSKSTGVPAGVTLRPSGELVINTPGMIVDGLDILGMVTVNAPNVTLKNCKVTAASWAVINITAGATGAIVKNCEINGASAEGVRGISGHGTFINNDIHHVEDGIYILGSNTLIDGNYIHDLQSNWSGPHYDGIATDGGVSNIVIRNNTIINQHGQTSAIMLSNYFGPISDVTIHNNRLVGGGYTVYSDGQFSGGAISGVSITNNDLGKGRFGYMSIRNNSPIWQENVDEITGRPIGPGRARPPRQGLR
jgi:nitrous oxidase accessory protein NosD